VTDKGEAVDAERVCEVDDVGCESGKLTRARRIGAKKACWAEAAQIGRDRSEACGMKRIYNAIPGSDVVWPAVKQQNA